MATIKKSSEDIKTASIFLIIPTLMLIFGYLIYPYPPTNISLAFIRILLFFSLLLLGIGFFIKHNGLGNKLKTIGWLLFAFYWSTQPAFLYLSEDGDFINAFICVVGVYVLSYLAYHEWLSFKRKEEISCLNWIAGASCLAGIIYFGIEFSPLQLWLREVVAIHSAWFLELVTGETVYVESVYFVYKSANIQLIFACTAVQAMVIFVGIILPLPKVDIKRKIIGLLITIIPVYILNFMRNALVTYLVGNDITDFNIAHNWIAKGGALITLIVLLLIVIKIIPEVFDEIIAITDLPKRDGPLEKFFKKYFLKGK
jgi:archaeosortase A (PGF-CTERM-specific)